MDIVHRIADRYRLRFWSRVAIGRPTACWPWLGATVGGYGVLRVRGPMLRAHRIAYELQQGPIPAGLVLDHLCRNTRCVNPFHLEPVTNRENIIRGDAPPARNARKTHCLRGHPYDEENTRTGKGKRYCRACEREHSKAYYGSNAGRARQRELRASRRAAVAP